MPLSPQDVEQIAAATAKKLQDGHACRFNDEEAAVVHGFRRAMKEHKAGEKEIFIVIQLGKNLTEFVEGLSKKVLWLIIGGALFLICGFSSGWKFWFLK